MPDEIIIDERESATVSGGEPSIIITGPTVLVDGNQAFVTGPASSLDNAIARWNGLTGLILQDSPILVSDAGLLQFGGITDAFSALKNIAGALHARDAADSALIDFFALSLIASAAGYFRFDGSSRISAPNDGEILISNNAGDDFGRLIFGAATAAFPLLRRSGSGLVLNNAALTGFGTFTAGSLISNGDIRVTAARKFHWLNQAAMTSPDDGKVALLNNALDDFEMLILGLATSAFPAWKRSGVTLQARLGDDSDYCDVETRDLEVKGDFTNAGAGYSSLWYHGPEITTTISAQNTFAKFTGFQNVGDEDVNGVVIGDASANDFDINAAGPYCVGVQATFRNAGGAARSMQFNPRVNLATPKTVADATNATPIVVTTSAAHGIKPGDMCQISGVLGNLAANGDFFISAVTPTTITLQALNHVDTTGSGAYTSGGTVDSVCPGNAMIERKVGFTDLARGAGAGIVVLAAGDVIDLVVANTDNADNLIVSQANLTVMRIQGA